jgi:hypothetical protein
LDAKEKRDYFLKQKKELAHCIREEVDAVKVQKLQQDKDVAAQQFQRHDENYKYYMTLFSEAWIEQHVADKSKASSSATISVAEGIFRFGVMSVGPSLRQSSRSGAKGKGKEIAMPVLLEDPKLKELAVLEAQFSAESGVAEVASDGSRHEELQAAASRHKQTRQRVKEMTSNWDVSFISSSVVASTSSTTPSINDDYALYVELGVSAGHSVNR